MPREHIGEQTGNWFARIVGGGDVSKSFHYSPAYPKGMKAQAFWDAEFDRIHGIDSTLFRTRRGPA